MGIRQSRWRPAMGWASVLLLCLAELSPVTAMAQVAYRSMDDLRMESTAAERFGINGISARRWRDRAVEIGASGARVELFAGSAANRFGEPAVDGQYQLVGDLRSLTLALTRVHEWMKLDASLAAGATASSTDTVRTKRVWGTYYYHGLHTATLARFSTTGSADPLLFPVTNPFASALAAPCTGPTPPAACGIAASERSTPDTSGWIGEVSYVPWTNTKFSLQYTRYSGGAPAERNTFFLVGWFAF